MRPSDVPPVWCALCNRQVAAVHVGVLYGDEIEVVAECHGRRSSLRYPRELLADAQFRMQADNFTFFRDDALAVRLGEMQDPREYVWRTSRADSLSGEVIRRYRPDPAPPAPESPPSKPATAKGRIRRIRRD